MPWFRTQTFNITNKISTSPIHHLTQHYAPHTSPTERWPETHKKRPVDYKGIKKENQDSYGCIGNDVLEPSEKLRYVGICTVWRHFWFVSMAKCYLMVFLYEEKGTRGEDKRDLEKGNASHLPRRAPEVR